MALLKFEPPKELAPLRIKIARPVALALADLVERALVYVMDHDADFRAREMGASRALPTVLRRPSVRKASPA